MRAFNINPNKGLEFAIEKKVVHNDVESIANFLFRAAGLSPAKLGIWLGGEKLRNKSALEYWARSLNFTDLSVGTALRQFVSRARPPTTDPDIFERLMDTFGNSYCERLSFACLPHGAVTN